MKLIMRTSGAMRSLMSGSGPAVFGVFDNQGEAEVACSRLQEKGYRAFVCHPTKQYID